MIQKNKQEKLEELENLVKKIDTAWLSLQMGKTPLLENVVMTAEEAMARNGAFGNIKCLIVTEVPLNNNGTEDVTRYIFNQIDIHELTVANKKLLEKIRK